jgi:hypothetical protein
VKSPWKSFEALVPDREYLVLASLIPPKSVRSTAALFRGSREVRRQLAATDGVVGFALLAEPLRKRYATLSVWRDEDALAAFAAGRPHSRLTGELGPAMGATRFERWTITGDAGRPSWADALARLGSQPA